MSELLNRLWYWVEYEGIGRTYQAPAMYIKDCDCFYSYEFSGIPTRQLKAISAINIVNTRTPQWQPNAEEVLMKLKRLWDAGWFTSDDRNCITFDSIMDSLPTPPNKDKT